MSTIKKHKLLLILILSIGLITWFVSAFLVQVTIIIGDSMLPTYKNRQLLLIDKIHDEYDVGDVIVFRDPDGHGVIIKRVVATSGDKLVIEDGKLFVNGVESKFYNVAIDDAGNLESEITVTDGEYFVMGDNVNHSIDSRFDEVGLVSESSIIGKIIKK